MKIHLFTHADFENSEIIETWIKNNHYQMVKILVPLAPSLPSPEEIGSLIILGGPMSVYDPLDWIKKEIALVKNLLETGKPVFGICLGSQIMAQALGARVYPAQEKEIGWFDVELNPEALELFPFLPNIWKVFHWHGDTYDLPEGVHALGSSQITRHQGFFKAPHSIALQFHPEVSPGEVDGFFQDSGFRNPDATYPEECYKENQNYLTKILDIWIQGLPQPKPCPLCTPLKKPWTITNHLDETSPKIHQEFPDEFLNLRIPDKDLLLFYRNTEIRLLKCEACDTYFLYQQVKTSDKNLIQEELRPLNSQGMQNELHWIEQQAISQANAWESTYRAHLNKILEAVKRLKGEVRGK